MLPNQHLVLGEHLLIVARLATPLRYDDFTLTWD